MYYTVIKYYTDVICLGYFQNLDPDPGPWTRILDRGPEKPGKQLDMEKWLEDHIL